MVAVIGLVGCRASVETPSPRSAEPRASTFPSASASASVVPTVAAYAGGLGGYQTRVLLSVGDAVPRVGGGSYRMVGLPDGLGLEVERGRRFLYVNHEFGGDTVSEPIVGGEAQRGAIVSRFEMDAGGRILNGDIAYEKVFVNDNLVGPRASSGNSTRGFGRFCSATFAGAEVGFDPPMYLTGEEADADSSFDQRGGQSVAVFNDEIHVLSSLGHFQRENTVIMSGTADRTVALITEDGPSGPNSQLWMYVGMKDRSAGATPLARNGLVGGNLYVLIADGHKAESDFTGGGTQARWRQIVGADKMTSSALEAAADNAGAFGFVRIEDGAFAESGQFFFATTGGSDGNSLGRIYSLTINKADPLAEAGLSIVHNADAVTAAGRDTAVSPDNLGVSRDSLLINEDATGPGRQWMSGHNRHAAIWLIPIKQPTTAPTKVAEMTPPGRDGRPVEPGAWESSGTIDASPAFGPNTWLFDVQAHPPTKPPSPTDVEDGQILLLTRQ